MGDRRLMGEMLVEAGLVRRNDLESALAEQRARGGRLCYHLMRLGKVTPGSLYLFLQNHFGTISPDLLQLLRTGPAADLIPAKLAHFYHMVPLRRDGDTLLLALSTVDNPNLIPAVEELTGLKVDPLICPPGLIQEALEKFFGTQDETGVVRDVVGDNVLVLADPRLGLAPAPLESIAPTASPFEWVRALVAEAIKRQSREILLEPLEDETRVSYRPREGQETSRSLTTSMRDSIHLALEDLAKLAARGRTVPREGRFRLQHGDRSLAVLVTSLPGLHGDAYHLRLVEERIRRESLEEMVEDYPEARSELEEAIGARKGLLLLAAPEGHYRERVLSALITFVRWKAGHTVFLASSGAPRVPGVDTRELEAPGAPPLVQMVAAARRDRPDLLGISGLRNREEVAASFQAAGEAIVVAGVRKADAFEALTWLIREGFLREIRAGRLLGVLGLRMVERICEHCRRRYDLLEEFPNLLPSLNGKGLFFANTGCRACRGAGVLDLEPAFEFLPGATALADRLARTADPESVRRDQVRAGVKTLFASMMARAATGEVDVREPLRLLFREGRGAA